MCESCWAEGERRSRSLTRLFEQPEEIQPEAGLTPKTGREAKVTTE